MMNHDSGEYQEIERDLENSEINNLFLKSREAIVFAGAIEKFSLSGIEQREPKPVACTREIDLEAAASALRIDPEIETLTGVSAQYIEAHMIDDEPGAYPYGPVVVVLISSEVRGFPEIADDNDIDGTVYTKTVLIHIQEMTGDAAKAVALLDSGYYSEYAVKGGGTIVGFDEKTDRNSNFDEPDCATTQRHDSAERRAMTAADEHTIRALLATIK